MVAICADGLTGPVRTFDALLCGIVCEERLHWQKKEWIIGGASNEAH